MLPVAINLTAEYAFPVLEANKEADGPKNVRTTLPNKIFKKNDFLWDIHIGT